MSPNFSLALFLNNFTSWAAITFVLHQVNDIALFCVSPCVLLYELLSCVQAACSQMYDLEELFFKLEMAC
jgi:hypothetical protein